MLAIFGPEAEKRATVLATLAPALVVLAVLLAADRLGADARYDDNVFAGGPAIATSLRLWREGWPFWNPYAHFGEPTLPQVGSGVLYPPGLLTGFAFSLENIPQAWVVLHASLAAAGAAFAARTLGCRAPGAALAGIAYGLGAPVLHVAKCWMIVGLAGAWTPWVLAFLVRAARGSLAGAGWAALLLGLQVHAGSVEGAFWAVAIGGLLAVLERGSLRLPLLALVLGGLLASPLVLETLASLGGTNRELSHHAGGVQIAPEALVGAIFPALPGRKEIPWMPPVGFQTALYQGFVPLLVLATAGIGKRPSERTLAAIGALAVFLALGTHTLATELWDRLPVLRLLHHPVGRLHVAGLAVALLAGLGLERFATVRASRIAFVGGALLGGSGLAAGLAAWLFLDARARLAGVAGTAIALGALSIAAVVALALVRERRPLVAVLATAVLLGTQVALLWTGVSSYSPPPSEDTAPVVSAARASGGRVLPVFTEHELVSLPYALSAARGAGGVFGFASASGYSVVYAHWLPELWGLAPKGGTTSDSSRLFAGSALEAGGIQFLHGGAELRAAPPGRFIERWRRGRTLTLENPRYAGRAYRVAAAEAAPLDLSRGDLLSVALVESGSPLAGRSFATGPVTRFEERPGTIRAELTPLAGPSLLVVTSAFDGRWQAEVDGKPAPVHRILGCFLGVETGPGSHAVSLRHESAALGLGLALAALGLVGVVVCLVAKRSPRNADAALPGSAAPTSPLPTFS